MESVGWRGAEPELSWEVSTSCLITAALYKVLIFSVSHRTSRVTCHASSRDKVGLTRRGKWPSCHLITARGKCQAQYPPLQWADEPQYIHPWSGLTEACRWWGWLGLAIMVAPARPGSNYTQPSTITELESCGCRYKTSSFGVLKQPISVNLTTAIVSSGPPCGWGPGARWQLSLIFPTFQQFNGIKLTSQNLTTQIYF